MKEKNNQKKNNKEKSKLNIVKNIFIVLSIIGIIAWSAVFALNFTIDKVDEDLSGETDNPITTSKKSIIQFLFCGENEFLTDTIIYAKCDLNTGKIFMMSVPRDTYIDNKYAVGHKINSIYRGTNIIPLVKQVEELLDVNIDYYAVINNKVVREVVDAIGGIEINVPIRMKYDDYTQDLHIDLQPGLQTLNGSQAEQFIRFRKGNDGSGYRMGDLDRLNVQQDFIKKFIETLINPKNLLKLGNLVEIGLKNTDTNVTIREALRYTDDLGKLNMSNIESKTASGTPQYIDGLSYFLMDKTESRKIIKDYFLTNTDESVTTE